MSDAPFIRKGEQVIVDGELICTVKRDIQSGEMFRVADFQWFITPPVSGEAADATPGFRTTNGAPDIFLSGEWLSDRVIAAKLRKAADIAIKAGDDYIAEMKADDPKKTLAAEHLRKTWGKLLKRIDKIGRF